MTEEQNKQPEQNQTPEIKNVQDVLRELRDENAARRVENNDLKTLLAGIKELLEKGQAPQMPEPKTEKGKQVSEELNQALEGYKARLEAAEKVAGDFNTLKEQLEAERKAREASELQTLKIKTAAKYRLPDALADRLQGSTPEEIEEDAKRLAPLVGSGQSILGNTGEPNRTSKARQLIDLAVKGRSENPFDPNVARRTGGGVFSQIEKED